MAGGGSPGPPLAGGQRAQKGPLLDPPYRGVKNRLKTIFLTKNGPYFYVFFINIKKHLIFVFMIIKTRSFV